MNGIYLLKNSVQEYDWGSQTAIAELLGNPQPSPVPQAELWMGAHPKAPSLVIAPDGDIPLNDFIAGDPEKVLGTATARRFENRLPYLFKVLAAAKPLSIQAHPDLEQARQGFERENKKGIDIKAPERNYRDANHKPECICALTDYWALNGFRESGDIARRMQTLCPGTLQEVIDRTLLPDGTDDLRRFFEALMTLKAGSCRRVVSEALENLHRLPGKDETAPWMKSLQDEYPYDIGVLSPSFLNLVCLQPGQAMFLPAGQLHAYLEGVGIELMANSDNVLRGGLTPKHVDVAELMRVLNFKVTPLEILLPEPVSVTEQVFRTAADEFELSVIDTKNSWPHTNQRRDAAQILLCTTGRGTVSRQAESGTISVRKGSCLLVEADTPAFQIEGEATFYKAAVPEKA